MLLRKIVSNLPFSPAMLHQLGFYAKRLKKEQATRRLGLLFTALALIVQSFTLFNPPEAALATNPNNIIFSGISSKQDLLQAWDRNTDGHGHNDIQQIFKYFFGNDFSRQDIENTNKGTFGSRDKINGGRIMSLGRAPQTSDPAQKAHNITDAKGKNSTIWSRHLDAFDKGVNTKGRGSLYEGFVGNHKGKWFAIMSDCGNIAFPETHEPPSTTPQMTIKATCRQISGYAYDKSNLNTKLKIYLYLGGGPGKGQKFSTVASLASPDDSVEGAHGFLFAVPSSYFTGKTYDYTVIANPSKTSGEPSETKGRLATSDCKDTQANVECTSLRVQPTSGSRNKFRLAATSVGQVNAYQYTVTRNNNVASAFTKTYPTTANTHTTEEFTLADSGTYTAAATVVSGTAQKTNANCSLALTVAPPEKCPLNPTLGATDQNCKPCPGDSTVWVNDESCAPEIIKSKTVQNLTQMINDANNTTVRAGERLQYNLYIENTGTMPATLTIDENLADVLEYATLTDFGGQDTTSAFNKDTQILTWKDTTIAPGQKLTKSVTVAVKEQIPTTPASVGNPESYDCKMSNVFGAAHITVHVGCPPEKVVENTISSLPKTGAGTNIMFGTALVVLATYFYARIRQLRKEAALLHKEFNYGSI